MDQESVALQVPASVQPLQAHAAAADLILFDEVSKGEQWQNTQTNLVLEEVQSPPQPSSTCRAGIGMTRRAGTWLVASWWLGTALAGVSVLTITQIFRESVILSSMLPHACCYPAE